MDTVKCFMCYIKQARVNFIINFTDHSSTLQFRGFLLPLSVMLLSSSLHNIFGGNIKAPSVHRQIILDKRGKKQGFMANINPNLISEEWLYSTFHSALLLAIYPFGFVSLRNQYCQYKALVHPLQFH